MSHFARALSAALACLRKPSSSSPRDLEKQPKSQDQGRLLEMFHRSFNNGCLLAFLLCLLFPISSRETKALLAFSLSKKCAICLPTCAIFNEHTPPFCPLTHQMYVDLGHCCLLNSSFKLSKLTSLCPLDLVSTFDIQSLRTGDQSYPRATSSVTKTPTEACSYKPGIAFRNRRDDKWLCSYKLPPPDLCGG
jgi:hypothetical protein